MGNSAKSVLLLCHPIITPHRPVVQWENAVVHLRSKCSSLRMSCVDRCDLAGLDRFQAVLGLESRGTIAPAPVLRAACGSMTCKALPALH